MRELAAQGIRARVFAVGYPLAPDQPFPRSIQGVAEAYQWLVQEMGSSDSIILDLSQTSVFLRHKQQQRQSGSGATAPLLAAESSSNEQDVFQWDYVSSTEGQLMLRQYVFSKDQNTLTNPLVSPIYLQYHEEAAKPHCYALLDMGDWLELGAQAIVPFIANMAVQKKGQ
eukprot:gene10130-10288_t